MVPPIPQPVSAANTPTTLRFQPGGSASSTATGGLHFLVPLCASFSRLGYSPLHTSHVLMAPNPTCMPRASARTAHHIASYRIVSTSKRGKQLSAKPCPSSARVTVAHTARVHLSIPQCTPERGIMDGLPNDSANVYTPLASCPFLTHPPLPPQDAITVKYVRSRPAIIPENNPPPDMVGAQGRRGVPPSAPGKLAAPVAGSVQVKTPRKDVDGRFPCPHCTKTYLNAKHLKRHFLRRKFPPVFSLRPAGIWRSGSFPSVNGL